MQHGVAPTLTDTPVAFTLKNIVAFTLKIMLHLPWKSGIVIYSSVVGICLHT